VRTPGTNRVKALATKVQESASLETSRFMRLSLRLNLVKGVIKLISTARSYNRSNKATHESSDETTYIQPRDSAVEIRKQAEMVIMRCLQWRFGR
jgi:hypothetical protein